MKSIYKSFFLLLFALAAAGLFTACSEDEKLANGGTPQVKYVRVTKPEAADSLLVAAGQGSMVAIVGENLGDAREVWFNDQRAVLSPTFVTNTSIITRVPAMIPTEISNQLVIKFANGQSLSHDFAVDISEPLVTGMDNEFAAPGGVTAIRGDFFYKPLTVTFTGGAAAEIVSVEDKLVQVKVPAGAQPGPVTVKTNFGEVVSDFWYRDNRNVFGSMDLTTNGWWHGADKIKAADPEITAIDGKFLRVKNELTQGQWYEFFVAPTASDVSLGTKNIPADAITNPKAYDLKFEINTLSPLSGAQIKMYIGNDMGGERGNKFYAWKPNVDTKGEWQTVAISFEQIIEKTAPAVSANGYGVSFWFHEGAALNANFALDNMRVVPKTLK